MIHPDWCSEKIDRPQFEGRPYRPWSYEFQGARTYRSAGDKSRSRRIQSAPATRATISVNNAPGVHHSLTQSRSQPRAASATRASPKTRDYTVIYPKTMMYVYEDGECHRNKYNASQPLDGTNIPKFSHPLPPDVNRETYQPPPGGYRITTAPDGSIRRLRMTPAATSLYVNTMDTSVYQQMSPPDTFWTVPQGLGMECGDNNERDYITNPDLAELNDHLHYLPDGKYYLSNQYGSHNNSIRNQMAPVDYRYPAATYRSGGAPQPTWVGDTHLRNAKYASTPQRNPYMNFVNSTWMV